MELEKLVPLIEPPSPMKIPLSIVVEATLVSKKAVTLELELLTGCGDPVDEHHNPMLLLEESTPYPRRVLPVLVSPKAVPSTNGVMGDEPGPGGPTGP